VWESELWFKRLLQLSWRIRGRLLALFSPICAKWSSVSGLALKEARVSVCCRLRQQMETVAHRTAIWSTTSDAHRHVTMPYTRPDLCSRSRSSMCSLSLWNHWGPGFANQAGHDHLMSQPDQLIFPVSAATLPREIIDPKTPVRSGAEAAAPWSSMRPQASVS